MGERRESMPLTELQSEIARLLSDNRTPESYLAGGAALHIEPRSERYSNDLDFFHDSEEVLARSFGDDRSSLESNGFGVEVILSQPGFVRALVGRGEVKTKVEWAVETAWRFMPLIEDERAGYVLHPVDLAINKLLALVGRDEPRDFLDVLYAHENVLGLGAQCWAAAGKDPGYTPLLLLDLLGRRGVYRGEDFKRLSTVDPVDLERMKQTWLAALESADGFVRSRPAEEMGCLYYSKEKARFVEPSGEDEDFAVHFGRPGGVLPRFGEAE